MCHILIISTVCIESSFCHHIFQIDSELFGDILGKVVHSDIYACIAVVTEFCCVIGIRCFFGKVDKTCSIFMVTAKVKHKLVINENPHVIIAHKFKSGINSTCSIYGIYFSVFADFEFDVEISTETKVVVLTVVTVFVVERKIRYGSYIFGYLITVIISDKSTL